MRSYVFPIVVEQDGDKWRASVPSLEARGAATWGHSRDEVVRNIQEVVQMVVEEMLADGESLPDDVHESDAPAVAVNI